MHAGTNESQVLYLEKCVARGLSGGATLVLRLVLHLKLPDSGGEFVQLSFLRAVCRRSILRIGFLLQIRGNEPNARRSDEGTEP